MKTEEQAIAAPLKTTEAARALGVSRATVYRMINDGRLIAYEPIRGQLRIEPSEIERIKQETRRHPRESDDGPMIKPAARAIGSRPGTTLREQLTAIRGETAA
jgi:excisionase family DNA binding protein